MNTKLWKSGITVAITGTILSLNGLGIGAGSGSLFAECSKCIAPQPVAQFPLTGTTQVMVPMTNVVANADMDSATATPGQRFELTTRSPLVVNNQVFPAGSVMTAEAIGIQGATKADVGKVQLVITAIRDPQGNMVVFARPEDIQATVAFDSRVARTDEGFFKRTLSAPGRIIGGVSESVGNMTGSIFRTAATTTGAVIGGGVTTAVDLATLQPVAGVKSATSTLMAPVTGVREFATTGVMGPYDMAKTTTGEALYIVKPGSLKTTSIHAGDEVSVCFVQIVSN